MISIVSSEHQENHEKKVKKIKFTKDLEETKISTNNENKLLDYYKDKFKKVNKFNNYRQSENITIINVSIDNNYARIITHTDNFNRIIGG